MKIPFDIKYRPEIESGKYKVITVVDNKPVRIICWDRKSCYKPDGQYIIYLADLGREELCVNLPLRDCKKSLEIITDEPEELTEFEQEIKRCLAFNYGIEFDDNSNELLKSICRSILSLARKELEKNHWIEMQEYWCSKGHLEGYAKGQEDAEKRFREHQPVMYYYNPPCFVGGPCTNPHHDCINCPRTGTSGIAKTDTNIK